MLIGDTLNPPIQYNIIWFIIGSILVVVILLWYGLVYWLTRRKKIKSIDDLKHLPTGKELDRLKAKYLKIIEELYQRYLRKEIKLRQFHRELSMDVRAFVFEAKHFPAPILTLSDFKAAPYPTLTKLISDYYPEEFAAIESGDAASSVAAAKGFILQWN
jgi:hypothetical protein